jgi:hypothetical protein
MFKNKWVIGIVVVVAIAVIVYFVMKNKKDKKTTNVNGTANGTGSVEASLPTTEVKPEDIVAQASELQTR